MSSDIFVRKQDETKRHTSEMMGNKNGESSLSCESGFCIPLLLFFQHNRQLFCYLLILGGG